MNNHQQWTLEVYRSRLAIIWADAPESIAKNNREAIKAFLTEVEARHAKVAA